MSDGPNSFMQMYWGDYARDTGHLNNAGHGAYLMLIKHYWCSGRPLPDDDAQLWRIACCDSIGAWRKQRPQLERFFVIRGGSWHHKRIDAELAKAAEKFAKRSAAGRKGNDTRWNDDRNATTAASQCDPNAIPLRSHLPEPERKIGGGGDAGARDRTRPKFDPATERVIEAAEADPDKQAGWMTASATVQKWLGHGADLELDVLPAIAAAMVSRRGRGPPNSPSYFDRPVLEARERRLAPLPDVTVVPIEGARNGSRKPHDLVDRQHALDAGLAAAALRRMGPRDG